MRSVWEARGQREWEGTNMVMDYTCASGFSAALGSVEVHGSVLALLRGAMWHLLQVLLWSQPRPEYSEHLSGGLQCLAQPPSGGPCHV